MRASRRRSGSHERSELVMVRGMGLVQGGCDSNVCSLQDNPFLSTTMSTMPTMRTAYNLIKYSRATPRESQSGRGLELDWHHCTEPVLRLLLEIRRTPSGIPDSTRMRVVWTRVSNGTSHENTVLVSSRVHDSETIFVNLHYHIFRRTSTLQLCKNTHPSWQCRVPSR